VPGFFLLLDVEDVTDGGRAEAMVAITPAKTAKTMNAI
jgi:hypothetical protein